MFYTNDTLKVIHETFHRKFGEVLILSKGHKKAISDYVDSHDGDDGDEHRGQKDLLVAWLGHLFDCQYQPDWRTTKLKAHRFITNMEGYWVQGNSMLPFTVDQLRVLGRANNEKGWLRYLLEKLDRLGVEVVKKESVSK